MCTFYKYNSLVKSLSCGVFLVYFIHVFYTDDSCVRNIQAYKQSRISKALSQSCADCVF